MKYTFKRIMEQFIGIIYFGSKKVIIKVYIYQHIPACVCACMYACVRVCVRVCLRMYMCVWSSEVETVVFLYSDTCYFLRKSISLNLELRLG